MRSSTLAHLRRENRDRLQALRESLPDDDQELLILRIDKGMSFRDIATVVSDPGADEPALTRASARLRKRFQLVKERMRDAARREGLV